MPVYIRSKGLWAAILWAAISPACVLCAAAVPASAQNPDQWTNPDEPRRYQQRPDPGQYEPYDEPAGPRYLRRYQPRPQSRDQIPDDVDNSDGDGDGDYEYRNYRYRSYDDRNYGTREPEDGRNTPRAPGTAEKPAKPDGSDGGGRPYIQPAAPPVVAFGAGYAPGSIVIDTGARRLFYVRSNMSAFAYPIAVGREGFAWTGSEKISRVSDWPDWYPPDDMRKRKPELPERMLGGIRNPLGAKALYLGNTLYRIHGTNDPKSIGKAESSGCFRMLNEHVLHLASLVQTGTQVTVVRSLGRAAVAAVTPAPAVRTKVIAQQNPPVRQLWHQRPSHPRWSNRPLPPLRWRDPYYAGERPAYWRYRRDWEFPEDTR